MASCQFYKGTNSNVRMAKFGIALDLRSRGRGFESCFITVPCSLLAAPLCLSQRSTPTEIIRIRSALPCVSQQSQRPWKRHAEQSGEKYGQQSYILRHKKSTDWTPLLYRALYFGPKQLHKGTNSHTLLLNAAVHRTRRLLQTRCLVRHAQQLGTIDRPPGIGFPARSCDRGWRLYTIHIQDVDESSAVFVGEFHRSSEPCLVLLIRCHTASSKAHTAICGER